MSSATGLLLSPAEPVRLVVLSSRSSLTRSPVDRAHQEAEISKEADSLAGRTGCLGNA